MNSYTDWLITTVTQYQYETQSGGDPTLSNICHPVSVSVRADMTSLSPETTQQHTLSSPLGAAWESDSVTGCPAVTMRGQPTYGGPGRPGQQGGL